MHHSDFLTQGEAAEVLKLSPRTLERWRVEPPKGGNPLPFARAGRRILYRREDINAFVEARLFTNTTEAEAWEGRSHD